MNKKIILIATLAILAGCTDISVIQNKMQSKREIIKEEFEMFNKNSLVGKEFILESEGYKNSGVFIGFTKDRFYGFSGINRFFGNYTIEDNKLIIPNIGITRMAGKKEDIIKEFLFISKIKEKNEIRLEDYKLILKSPEGLELEFRDKDYKEEIPAQIQNKKQKIKK